MRERDLIEPGDLLPIAGVIGVDADRAAVVARGMG